MVNGLNGYMNRPTRDQYFLEMAALAATRGTCARRKVGCIIVNKLGHVLATGYNGVAKGQPHCIDTACPGANLPSGQGLELCEAIHAEQNALLQCRDVNDIETCYITNSPCITCVKLLMNTSCRRIVFIEPYAHNESAKNLWQSYHPANVWSHNGN